MTELWLTPFRVTVAWLWNGHATVLFICHCSMTGMDMPRYCLLLLPFPNWWAFRLFPFPFLPLVVLVSDTVGIPCASHSCQGSSGEVGLLQPTRLPSPFSVYPLTLANPNPTWIPSPSTPLCFWWGPSPGMLSFPIFPRVNPAHILRCWSCVHSSRGLKLSASSSEIFLGTYHFIVRLIWWSYSEFWALWGQGQNLPGSV